MDDMTRFEDQFAERVRAFAKAGVQSVDSAAVARAVAVGHPKTVTIKPDQRRRLDEIGRPRSISRTTLAAAAVVAMIALGGALLVVAGGPSPTPSARPRPSLPIVVAPSPEPSVTATNSSGFPRSTGAWIATGTMDRPRDGHTAVRLNDGRVLVTGGTEQANDTSVELYDPISGTWSATGDMLHPQAGFPATLLPDGNVLVGDVDDPAAEEWTTGAEVYDPERGTWSSAGTLFTTQGWMAGTTATVLSDGKVLVAGNDGAQVYDPDSGTWSATGALITPRHHHTATLLPDGKVLVAGGTNDRDGMVYSTELYDPDTGSWTAVADTHNGGRCRAGCPRGGGMATPLQDGTVLFIRPSSNSDEHDVVEIYDPATGAWTPRDMARPDTHYSTVTLLLDGTVLLAGGPAELYDPAGGSRTETGNTLYGRSSATLLLDGTVLVAGGLNGTGTTSSAERYIPAGVSPPPAVAALPSPSPIPTPTPSPTPTQPPPPVPPAVGPIPPDARTWTVTVDNKSSEPATLFQAEDGETGVGRLCGNVTPNVVPAGVTMEVTFLLPAKNVTSCWIWVNPVPGEGGSFFPTSDAPLKGGFHIDEGGQAMWG